MINKPSSTVIGLVITALSLLLATVIFVYRLPLSSFIFKTNDGAFNVILNRHYETQDLVTCLNNELSFRRARHTEPVQISFVGDSTMLALFESLLRV